MQTIEELRFPIGKFTRPDVVSNEQFHQYVGEIRSLPHELRNVVRQLTDNQLDMPYREGGWTLRQVVHHLLDSHVNSYIRLKLALTEENPTIKPYDEASWAELQDAKYGDVTLSLGMLDALHGRWSSTLENLTPDQIKRTFMHPESGVWRIDQNAAMYAWHGKHHLAHITELKKRRGW